MALDSDAKQDFKVVGTRPPRPDGIEKVTGRAMYGADATAPGMLVGRILRSPHAHAIIKSIDTSTAEALSCGRRQHRGHRPAGPEVDQGGLRGTSPRN